MGAIEFNDKVISFQAFGAGEAIVLLHGYLETKEVWNSFAAKLSNSFKVISIDIPGHGKSNMLSQKPSMNDLAKAINEVVIHLNINNHTIIGHSMGGYVAFAYAKLYPKKVNRLILLHSSFYADTEEKIKNREREINLIKKGKLDLILQTNLSKMFACENVVHHKKELTAIYNRAKKHDNQGVCSLIYSMMNREDYLLFSKSFTNPILYIFGKKDNYIPTKVAQEMTLLNPKAKVFWLDKSGHMGFVEQPEETLNAITNFIKTK